MSFVVVLPDWQQHPRTGGQLLERAICDTLATIGPTLVLAVTDSAIGEDEAMGFPLRLFQRRRIRLHERLLGPLPTIALWSRGKGLKSALTAAVSDTRVSHVILSRTYAAPNLPVKLHHAKLVVVTQNVEHLRVGHTRQGASWLRRWWLSLSARRTARLERATIRRSDSICALSLRDCQVFQTMASPGARIVHLPLVPDPQLLALSTGDRPPATVLFVGSLGYPPNQAAAHFLIGEVLPLIIPRYPHVRVLIAGSTPPTELLAIDRNNPRVTITADFSNEAAVFAQASVFVAPLAFQEGISVKTLNAFASGTPTVATEGVLATVGAIPGVHALAATTAPDFANQICTLLDDSSFATRLATAARSLVSEHFSQGAFEAALLRAMAP